MPVMLTMIEPNRAGKKPATENPGTRKAVKPSMAAFTTKRKKPSVMNVNGMVKKTTAGLTTAFTPPRTSAAKNRGGKPANSIPDMSSDAINKPTEVTRSRAQKPSKFLPLRH
jgi:hypothetical protein